MFVSFSAWQILAEGTDTVSIYFRINQSRIDTAYADNNSPDSIWILLFSSPDGCRISTARTVRCHGLAPIENELRGHFYHRKGIAIYSCGRSRICGAPARAPPSRPLAAHHQSVLLGRLGTQCRSGIRLEPPPKPEFERQMCLVESPEPPAGVPVDDGRVSLPLLFQAGIPPCGMLHRCLCADRNVRTDVQCQNRKGEFTKDG